MRHVSHLKLRLGQILIELVRLDIFVVIVADELLDVGLRSGSHGGGDRGRVSYRGRY